jgi:osmotically-inducible protein OsmY
MSTIQLQDRPTRHLREADADLLLRLRIALSVHKRAGWHLVEFTAQNGVVQLAGFVPTFYDRQLIGALVRHVAGVFGIEDHLAVGDPSIRQQVTDADATPLQSDSTTKPVSFRDPFRHVPVLSQSLDDMLVGPPVGVVHAI